MPALNSFVTLCLTEVCHGCFVVGGMCMMHGSGRADAWYLLPRSDRWETDMWYARLQQYWGGVVLSTKKTILPPSTTIY